MEQLLNATRSSVEEMAAAGSGSVLGTLDVEPVSSSEGLDDEESDCEVCDRSLTCAVQMRTLEAWLYS